MIAMDDLDSRPTPRRLPMGPQPTRRAAPVLLLFLAPLASGCAPDGSLVQGSGLRLSERAERTEARALDLRDAMRLVVSADLGSLRARASATETSGLTCRLQGHGRDAEEAKRVVDAIRIDVRREGDTVTVRPVGEPVVVVEGASRTELRPSTDLELTLPPGTRIEASIGSGDLEAEGALGSVEMRTKFGRLTVTGARGDVLVESRSGDVSISKVVGGSLYAGTDFGAVRLSGLEAEGIVAASKSGEVRCERLEASAIELRSSFGAVRVRGGKGAIVAKSESGGVEIDGFEGSVDAYSGFGAVKVEGVLTGVTARSKSGDVEVKALDASRVESEWVLDSSFGSIELGLAEGVSCEVDARTRFGSVRSDFPLEMKAETISSGSARGAIGKGGGKVSVGAKSGNIRLQKL